MDYRAIISSSLLSIGVDADRVHAIEAGAEMYGEHGLLDSVYLVSLIVAIEEVLEKAFPNKNSFCQRDLTLIDAFRDLDSLVSFLERGGTGAANDAQIRRSDK